jgi:hypothetical protein
MPQLDFAAGADRRAIHCEKDGKCGDEQHAGRDQGCAMRHKAIGHAVLVANSPPSGKRASAGGKSAR